MLNTILYYYYLCFIQVQIFSKDPLLSGDEGWWIGQIYKHADNAKAAPFVGTLQRLFVCVSKV